MQEKQAIVEKVEEQNKTEKPPQLFDLTSLQREANRTLGYTAKQTLDYLQSLYEKKLVTYPRTDKPLSDRGYEGDAAGIMQVCGREVRVESRAYRSCRSGHQQQ
jgi:DNA topoisomerase-3